MQAPLQFCMLTCDSIWLSIQFGFDKCPDHLVSFCLITMRLTVQEFCFYSLVPQIPIFLSVAAAYTCQWNGNIRTAIYNRQTLNIILQYCDQSFGFKIVLNDENSLLLLAFVIVKESNKESESFRHCTTMKLIACPADFMYFLYQENIDRDRAGLGAACLTCVR